MIYVLLVSAFLRLNKTSCIMKAIKNRVQLMGYLGADPEIKIFEETKKLANIRLAVNDRYKNAKGEWVDETQWFNLVAWSKLAVYAEKYLIKGIEVALNTSMMTTMLSLISYKSSN